MSFSLFSRNLKEARRDALASHYLVTHNFGTYQGDTSSVEGLYEYLLLDTKVSDSVTTTRLASAISSLQLYIHRAIEGYEGPLNTATKSWFEQGAFLDNWDTYNKRYSTWSGKEKLRFYAGNYIDPTLRTNKTQLFTELENNLSQGRLTRTLVDKAVITYLAGYDRLANITPRYVWGKHKDTCLYLVGGDNGQYFWREILRDSTGKPLYWGEWQPLPPGIDNDFVMMGMTPAGLECEWWSLEQRQPPGAEVPKNTMVRNRWRLGTDGRWEQVTPQLLYERFEPQLAKAQVHGLWDIDYNGIGGGGDTHTNYRIRLEFPPAGGLYGKVTGEYRSELNSSKHELEAWSVVPQSKYLRAIYPIPKNGYPVKCQGTFNPNEEAWHSGVSDSLGSCAVSVWYPSFPYYGCVIDGRVVCINDGNNFTYPMDAPPLIITTPNTLTVKSPDKARNLGVIAQQKGFEALLDYGRQGEIAADGTWYFGDEKCGDAFSGYSGLWLWEIFFHIPFLVATRLATEQRFEEAEYWYKFIFNSAGYRNSAGTLQMENGAPRYWNCYPLQKDTAWADFASLPASVDPDVIAMADPMHYKLAIFLHTLNMLTDRGDAAYRIAERDALTEAQMYYVQAQQLLGPCPDIPLSLSWPDPTLKAEAGQIQSPQTRSGGGLSFAGWLRAGDTNSVGDGDFLPPYNELILACHDKLAVRLFNLRHNLSLDGQPLSLQLYATPVSPSILHRQQDGGNSIVSETNLRQDAQPWGWRYPLLADAARTAIGQLIQFGSSLLAAMERRDNEQLTLLLQVQQSEVLRRQQEIAQKNLDSLRASLEGITHSQESAQQRRTHFDALIRGNLSAAEITGLTLRASAITTNAITASLLIVGGSLKAVPNIFGLACGGQDVGGPVLGVASSLQTIAQTLDQSAGISEVTAMYQRRAEEWALQRRQADSEMKQLSAQADSLRQQIAMQQKQIALTETESAFAWAVHTLQQTRFTGKELYNWMVGRLSALYYQMYDATVPVCLQACSALSRELGAGRADGLFRSGGWNDLYQGLLCGEYLSSELQKLDNIWLQHSALGLEATRTVSLAVLRGEPSGNLGDSIKQLLEKGTLDNTPNGTLSLNETTGIFSAVLNLPELDLKSAYGMKDKQCFIKNVSVTLPTLLGPYQDIEATLSSSDGMVATLSHGMQDNGQFVTRLDDSRFLPFEGMDPMKSGATLTLNLFRAGKAGAQRTLVENLSDVIFHIQYIMR